MTMWFARARARLACIAFGLGLVAATPMLHAQTCSIPGNAGAVTLATQPNTFFPGTGNVAAGATTIAVGAASGVATGIATGDLLLVVQMQGADLNTTNTNGYGDGSAGAGTSTVAFGNAGYAGGNLATNFVAGTYEWAVASGATPVGGGTVNLMSPLANAYATRANTVAVGKQAFQVIRVPQYSNLTLSGTIDVLPWDGARGGVLVLEATGDISLAGQTINGSGRGFRGAGAAEVPPQCTAGGVFNGAGCQQYLSTIASQLGASKGEGLAGTPGRIYGGDPTGAGGGVNTIGAVDGYPGGEGSRGAPGNAGGGGNQHNGGGGGGGNGGAGGKGGNTWNASSTAFAGLQLGAFGGAPSGNTASRWIVGGGGGAGEVGGNGYTAPDGAGGAGGALVVLRASRVTGGGTINVNGAPGQRARATDAAGGGGAGGTVVVAAGTLNAALTVNGNGGNGGAYQVNGPEQDGAGGGGGGGVLVTNVGGITFNAAGGAAGTTLSTACPPANVANDCGQTAGIATAGSTGYAIATPGVQVGYECLPALTVTKVTSTPLVTGSTGSTAGYVITVSNAGGGARFASLIDSTLPPGWGFASSTAPQYAPALPSAAGRLATGAETVALATTATWGAGAAPLSLPAVGSNTLTISHFSIAPVVGGVPSAVTFSFVATIPNTATVGTYHNPAGVSFLDPTRAAAAPVRVISPQTNVAANRTATAYAPNTYNNFAGAAATNVAGANYSGLQGGPAGEDVRLVPDFSITKTAPASATPGATFTYTVTPRNNGRPVAVQAFATTQATDVATAAAVGAQLGSSPLTVTDTFPAGVTVSSVFTGAGWTCTGTGTMACTLPDASAWPIAAATNFPVIAGTASFTVACSSSPTPRTNTVVISTGAGESVTANNSATAVTAATCVTTNLQVSKSNNATTVTSGGTTSYTLTVANLGPSNAPGVVVQDPAAAGLTCSAVTCAVTAGTASCPASPTVAALQGAGLVIPTLNAGSTVSFALTCAVTATGS